MRRFASERRGDGAVADGCRDRDLSHYAGPKGDCETGSIEDKRIAVLFTTSLRKALAAMNARSRKSNEPILNFDSIGCRSLRKATAWSSRRSSQRGQTSRPLRVQT
jgi:hypothetical protein